MIRTAFPISPVRQVQMRLEQWSNRRTRRALEERRRELRTGLAGSRPSENPVFSGDDYLIVRWREEVSRKRAAFDQFEDRYDRLIGLLCLAAQEGITPRREDSYRDQRLWFVKQYGTIKREVARYLEADAADATPSLWGKKTCDGFEALFLPTTLKAMLTADDGLLIGRMMRTQAALASYAEELSRSEAAINA